MTPKDFSAMTGLPVCGVQLRYDMQALTKKERIRNLFGKPMVKLIDTRVSWGDLYEYYVDYPRSTKQEVDQLTRVFLLALVGSVLCTDKSATMNLFYMPCLEYIDAIGKFNWGGQAWPPCTRTWTHSAEEERELAACGDCGRYGLVSI